MSKKKDKVRFGAVVFMLLFTGLLVFGCFYLSFQIEQNFKKPKTTTTTISNDDLSFIDVFYEIYSFPGCKEVDRNYVGDASIVYNVYYKDYKCEFYVDGKKVKIEDEYYIRDLKIFKQHSIKIICMDYLGNKVSKSKVLKNYC